MSSDRVISIQTADEPSATACPPKACGACVHSRAGEAGCRSDWGEDCLAAELSGPPEQLQRVMRSLGQRLGFAPEAPEAGGVRSLHIADDEVVLRLALPADGHAAAALAEAAWQTLRAVLPDTDIYVNPR